MTLQETVLTLGQIAQGQRATAHAQEYPGGFLVRISQASTGLKCWVDLKAGVVPVFVVSWYTSERRLSQSFAQRIFKGGWRGTTTCFSGASLLSVVELGLRNGLSGAAFEPHHASLVNLKAGGC